MTRQQAWDRLMWAAAACLTVLGIAAATGCGGVDPKRDDESVEITDDDPFGVGGDEDSEEVLYGKEGPNTARFGRSRAVDPENPDKGTTSMLMGWGIKGVLHFQDGVCAEPDCQTQPDHCSYFGLQCDNQWHIQARTLDFSSEAKFLADFTGACAESGSDSWYPCLMPKVQGNRTYKWKLDMTQCPQTNDYAAQRTAMINGWASVRAMTSDTTGNPVKGLGLKWTEVTDNSWDILVTCRRWAGANIQGMWVPNDSLTSLKYAVAIAGAPNNWVDDCTTSGLPGWNANPSLRNVGIQQQDMVYQYEKAVIYVDMVEMAATANNCTTDVNRRMFSYHNLILHELGHHLGLQHDRLADLDFAVMYDAQSCSEMTNRKMNLHPFYRDAVRSLDTSTTGSLTVWDDDISCFIPDEY